MKTKWETDAKSKFYQTCLRQFVQAGMSKYSMIYYLWSKKLRSCTYQNISLIFHKVSKIITHLES